RHNFSLQKRKNNMAAAENKRPGAIETSNSGSQPSRLPAARRGTIRRQKANLASAVIDSVRLGSRVNTSVFSGGALTRISFQPTSAPSAIVSTWIQELLVTV